MKKAIGLVLVGIFVLSTLAVQAAQKSATAERNLVWAGVTLAKVEKDLAEVIRDNKLTDTNALTAAFQSTRSKLASLKKVATGAAHDAENLAKVMDSTRNISGLALSVLDLISDLEGKRETFDKLADEYPALAKTDLGKRFDAEFQLLAGSLLRRVALQLEEKRIEAGEAEGQWSLRAMRCDQLIEEGSDEATYLAQKEDLGDAIRESGKTISLAPLAAAREIIRASQRQQQELTIEKQKQANQISQANLLTQLLDEKAGKLNEATDQAREAYDQAQERIQQTIDDNCR